MVNLRGFSAWLLILVLVGCTPAESTETIFDPPEDSTQTANPAIVAAAWQPIVLQAFVCGDNCYLRYSTNGSTEVAEALCRAPECGDWEGPGRLPDELRLQPAEAQFATDAQVDAAGTIMREDFPSIVALRLGARDERATVDNLLPLKPGQYVIAGTDCAEPANAGLRVWTGSGLEGSATRDCTLTVVSQDGRVYTVQQSCVNTYDESRTTTAFTLEVMDSSTVILQEANETAQFTRCPTASG